MLKEQIKEIYEGKVKPHKNFHTPVGWNDVSFLSSLHRCNMAILNFVPNYLVNKVSIDKAKKIAEKEKGK